MQLEADLRRFYRVDLLDLWRGALSPRRLASYVAGLPDDSATRAALQGEYAGWGIAELELAEVIDQLRAANWQRANAGAKPWKRSPFPQRVYRPGQTAREIASRTALSPSAIRARLLALRQRHRRPKKGGRKKG